MPTQLNVLYCSFSDATPTIPRAPAPYAPRRKTHAPRPRTVWRSDESKDTMPAASSPPPSVNKKYSMSAVVGPYRSAAAPSSSKSSQRNARPKHHAPATLQSGESARTRASEYRLNGNRSRSGVESVRLFPVDARQTPKFAVDLWEGSRQQSVSTSQSAQRDPA